MNQRSLLKLALLGAGALGAFAAHSRAQEPLPESVAPADQGDLIIEAGADDLSLYELVEAWADFEGHTVTLSELARTRLEETRTGLSGSLAVPAERVRGLVEDLLLWNGFAVSQVRALEPVVFGIHDGRVDDRHNARFLQLEPEELAAQPQLAALLVETIAVADGIDARQLTTSMRALMGRSWYDAALCTGDDFILLRGTAADVRMRLAWIAGAVRVEHAERERRAEREAEGGESLPDGEALGGSQRAYEPVLLSAADLYSELLPLLSGPARLVSLQLDGRPLARRARGVLVEAEFDVQASGDLPAAEALFAERARFVALPGARLLERGSLQPGAEPGQATLAFTLEIERGAASTEGPAAADPELFVIETAGEAAPAWRVESRYRVVNFGGGRLEEWELRPLGPLAPVGQPVTGAEQRAGLFTGLEAADGATVVTSLRVGREARGLEFRARLSRVVPDARAPAAAPRPGRD